jgi:hypothetical protein
MDMIGMLQFKSSKDFNNQSFQTTKEQYSIKDSNNKRYKILKLFRNEFKIRWSRDFPENCDYKTITISYKNGNFYVSFNISYENNSTFNNKNIPENTNKKSITSEEKNTKIVLTPLLNSYLKLKNALANDNANAAATLANEMKSSLTDLKKSTVPTDKAQMFNEVITDLAEHASHINSKSDDIEHQREHFVLI